MAKELTKEELLAENERLNEQVRERDDQLAKAAVEMETLKASMKGKKYVDLGAQVPFKAEWKDPAGKVQKRTMIFRNPKVRLPDGNASVVSSVALSKLAAEQELSESELNESPGLRKMDAKAAADLITKWAKIGAGVLTDAE